MRSAPRRLLNNSGQIRESAPPSAAPQEFDNTRALNSAESFLWYKLLACCLCFPELLKFKTDSVMVKAIDILLCVESSTQG